MENFENGSPRIKEKSVYLVHLDTARIIIISCVMIGIIIVAFLIGMNMNKQKGTSVDVAHKDNLFDMIPPETKGKDPFDTKTPPPPDSEIPLTPGDENAISRPADDKLSKNDRTPSGEDKKLNLPDNQSKEPSDVISQDNIKDAMPAQQELNKQEKKKPVGIAKKNRKLDREDRNEKTAKKSRTAKTVEVSSRVKSSDKAVKKSGSYTIQVGSFDTRSKAGKEAANLKKQKFDAFVENTMIHGKQYYRVKVGPIISRDRAIKMIGELQENDKYENSYLVKE
jgi:cell division septation protein DedD